MAEAVHSTFVIERVYAKPPERVFAAFTDLAKKRRWFAEGEGHDVEMFEMDFRVDGEERTLYRLGANSPMPGAVMATRSSYQQIIKDRLIVISQAMDFGGRRISAALVTFELVADGAGTKLVLTHQATFFEGADGPDMRRKGWETLIDKLARSLEA